MKVFDSLKKAWNSIKIKSKQIFNIIKLKCKQIFNIIKLKYNGLNDKNKKKLLIISSSILASLIIFSIVLGIILHPKVDDNNNPNIVSPISAIITYGSGSVEALVEISTKGGQILIDDTNSPANGLKIVVAEGSYNLPINFSIKTYPILEHKLGSDFNPITPIIEINNGHYFSKEIMKVEIPINITNDSFAMGFYYNEINGSLEAIPTLSLDNSKITLGVKHFSKIIVCDIPLSLIQTLTTVSNTVWDTGFTPALDDWHYTNYGSAIASGGHCAGQSLTMSWYYTEKYKTENQPRLYGRFDNNEDTDTPLFWEDDNNAYRFSSVIQETIDWSSTEWIDFINYCVANPKNTFNAFAYAIKTTNSPQFMGIFPSAPGMGHAIVAYKVEGYKIYVADPNFPGQTDRYVEYNPTTETFNAYSSGANASDINSNGATAYTKIVYVAKTALIDYDAIKENYDKLLNGTVGDSEFPDTVVEVLTKYNTDNDLIEWNTVSKEINLGVDYTNSLTQNLLNKALIKITPQSANLAYSLYLGSNTSPEQNPTVNVASGSLYYEVDLNLGVNDFGFLVEKQIGQNYYYVDFIRIRINYSDVNPSSVITFFSNGGTSVNDIIQEVGSLITASNPPTKPGYSFVGWYNDIGLNNAYSFNVMPNANTSLYAKWLDNELLSKVVGVYYLYSIGGSKNLGLMEYFCYEVNEDGTFIDRMKSINSSNELVNFGNWSLSGNIFTFDYGDTILYDVIADGESLTDLPTEETIFVYKKYKAVDVSVTITFDSNGGSAVSPITKSGGSDVSSPLSPTKPGSLFGGWYTDSALSQLFVFEKMPNKNITLYAKWNSASNLLALIPGTYELTYIGGVGAPNSENTEIVSETYYLYEDGTFSFIAYSKSSNVINFTGTWTLEGNILTISGLEYIFSGQNFVLDSCYPWTYTKI